MNNEQEKLGSASIPGLLFSLAAPAILAQIINVLYNMVDRMYLGHIEGYGDLALTGVGLTSPIIMCISAFAALVSMGGAPRAAIMLGKKDYEQAEKILGNCTMMLIIVSIILTISIELFAHPLLMSFGASENTITYALDYIKIYALGTICVQMTLGLNAFISTQGYAKISMLTTLIGAICNIILDPIFIFGLSMGVKGAALATIISQGISMIWVIRFLTSKKSFLQIKVSNFKIIPSVFLPCLALGISPFVMQFTESILSVSFNTSLLKYGGDLAVGAMTILTSVMQFSMLPLQGLSQGSQPIVSYNFGAGNMERVKESFKCLLISCLIYSTSLWIVSEFFPQILVGIFTNKEELYNYAIKVLRIYMGTSCMFGAQIACQQTFIALGNAKNSLFLALLRKIILLIPLIFILPHFFSTLEMKTIAVYLAEPIADFLAVCTTVTMFMRYFKKIMKEKKYVD